MRFSFCIPGADILLSESERKEATTAFYYERCKETTEKLGLEVFESNVGTLMTLTDEEVSALAAKYPDGGLRLYACCGLLPNLPNIVTANSEDTEKLYRHIDKTVSRLSALGARRLVFGSGWNRTVPENVSRDEAEKKIYGFIEYAARRCENTDIILALEPLNRGETNWCNTVKEGAEIVRKVNLPSFRLLADGYHMSREKEDLSVICENSDILFHCHIASENRRVPGSTEYEGKFIEALAKAGYNGVVSVECGYSDFFSEAPKTVEYLKMKASAVK